MAIEYIHGATNSTIDNITFDSGSNTLFVAFEELLVMVLIL
jgi:hypothetical protein